MAQKGIIKNSLTEGYVDATDFADIFQALLGENGILDYKEKLAMSQVDINTIRIKSGVYNLNGRLIKVDNYIDLSITNGTLGSNRIDYVIVEFVKNGNGIGEDLLHFKILRGESYILGETVKLPLLTKDETTYQEAIGEITIAGNTGISLKSMVADVIRPNKAILPLEKMIDSLNVSMKEVGLAMYPIGSVYTSTKSTNPESLFGGTWTRYGKGRVLIGIDEADTDFNSLKQGGAKSVTHAHMTPFGCDGSDFYARSTYTGSQVVNARRAHIKPTSMATGSTRQDATETTSVSLLQPYQTVYMWTRVA